jgi:hypothetical protein
VRLPIRFWKIYHKAEGESSKLKQAIASRFKENASIIFYILGIITSFIYPYIAIGFYYTVALYG